MASGRAIRAQDFANQAERHFAEGDASGKPRLFIPNALPRNNNLGFDFASEEEAFPKVDPRVEPAGSLVLVMVRQPKLRTAGGLVIDSDTRKTEFDNTQVAKVVALGSLAFKNRNDYKEWPEGAWCKVGDYVRIPKYQGDTFAVEYERDDFEIDEKTGKRRDFKAKDVVHFVNIKDLAILGRYPDADAALSARAFL